MRAAVGAFMWRRRKYTVLFIEKNSSALRDDDGSEIEVAVDKLGREAAPMASDTSGLLHLSPQAEDIEPRIGPWLQASIRVGASRSEVGVGRAIETERQWLEARLGSPSPHAPLTVGSKSFESRERPRLESVHGGRASGIRASSE